jgi:hypothetical protein
MAGWFDRWSGFAYRRSAEWLAICRILYAASQLVGSQQGPARPLAALGGAFFFPPLGPFALLSGYPPVWVLDATYLCRDISLMALLVGYRTTLAGWIVGITQIALAGVRYSTGKIDHEFLIFVVPVVMSFAGWGNALSVDALPDNAGGSRRRAPGPALAYLALLVGLTFFTSGFVKALSGWMDPGAAATRGYLLIFRQHLWSGGALNTMLGEIIGSLWLWKVMDYATVVFEMAVLVSVVQPAWFRTALTGALGFHLGAAALLRIDFSWLIGCYLPFLFSPASGTLGAVRCYVERSMARVGRWWPALVVAAGGVYWLLGQRRGYPALLQTWPYPLPRSLGVDALAATLAYVAWRDWLRPGRRASAVGGGPTEPGHGEVRTVRRRIVFLLTGLMLPAQLACMIWVSEPYPAPVGPLFTGNPDVRGGAQTFHQELSLMQEGRAIPVDETRLLGVPLWYARNIAGFRFPLEPVSVDGSPVSRHTWYEDLVIQGNINKFRALAFHGVRDRLSESERAYLVRRFPRAERLEVSWWREEIRVEGGRLVIDRTPLNAYSVPLR